MAVDISELKFFSTDPNRLDDELFAHPDNYFKVAEAVADARLEVEYQKVRVDVAKESVKSTDARLTLDAMKFPGKYGLDKPTVAAVEAAVMTAPDHDFVFRALIGEKEKLAQLEHDLGIKEAALGAMDCKKLALNKGVELRLANYHSTPRSGGGFGGERRQAPV